MTKSCGVKSIKLEEIPVLSDDHKIQAILLFTNYLYFFKKLVAFETELSLKIDLLK